MEQEIGQLRHHHQPEDGDLDTELHRIVNAVESLIQKLPKANGDENLMRIRSAARTFVNECEAFSNNKAAAMEAHQEDTASTELPPEPAVDLPLFLLSPLSSRRKRKRSASLPPAGRTSKTKAKAESQSARAGLKFPVGRIHRHLKDQITAPVRVCATAAVSAAATLEYLTAEVLDLAGKASKDLRAEKITPHHLQLAFRGDEDLDQLVKAATIPGGEVIPHESLIGEEGIAAAPAGELDA